MAEASQEETTLDRRTRIDFVNRIFQLIADNSLDEIKQILDNLPPGQCIEILNSSIEESVPLHKAIKHKNIEICRYLIKMSLLQGPREMCDSWKNCQHPLFTAIDSGNQELIELILQHLHDINDYIDGPLSPLMISTLMGDLTSVKLIVSMGADINQPSYQKRVPLMHSTSNSEICSFLLSKGANVNQQDEEGFTALHLAVLWNRTEGIHQLLNAGADVRIRNCEGITPLIAAIINLNMTMVNILFCQPGYSWLDRIEATEILNACCVCAQIPFIIGWVKTLQRRERMNLPKNCQIPAQEIFDFSEEFTTVAELENLQDNLLHLAFQSILVVERILGRNNMLYIKLHLQTALIAKNKNNMDKVRQLIEHVQENCQETSFVAANLSTFLILYSEIIGCGDQKIFFEFGGFAIFKIIAQTVKKMWIDLKDYVHIYPVFEDSYYFEIVDTFLYMISLSKFRSMSQEHISQFVETLKTVLKEDLRISNNETLLHRAITLMEFPPWGSTELIKILLEFGADANSRDNLRRTPIMYAFRYVPEDSLDDVLNLLTEYGGHPDCRSREGFTAMENSPLRCSLTTKPLTLQCLATRVILTHHIPYKGNLPKIIEDFVNFHK